MNTPTEHTTTTPAAGQSPDRDSVYQEAIDMIAQHFIAEGVQPMSGDDALFDGARKGWTIIEALKARCTAVDVEHAMRRLTPALAPAHVHHQINGLSLDLDFDGSLIIDSDEGGSLSLSPRAAMGLLMFFQFPGVAELITQGDAAQQREAEARFQTKLGA